MKKSRERNREWSGFKRVALVCLVALLVVCVSAVVFSEQDDGKSSKGEFKTDMYTFKIKSNSEVAIEKYHGKVTDLVIPGEVEYKGSVYKVTSIGKKVFAGHTEIETLVIPDCMKSLGKRAFFKCENLTYLSIPISLDASDYPLEPIFAGCQKIEVIDLTIGTGKGHDYKIDAPSSMYAYYPKPPWVLSHELKSINLAEGITHIGDLTFSYTQMESIVIPDSVTSVGKKVFKECENLTNITVPIHIPLFEDGILYECKNVKDITFTKGTGECAKYEKDNTPWHDRDDVNIQFSEGVENIEDYMFMSSPSIRTLDLPQSLKKIGESAFACCNNLESVTFKDSLTHIGNQAFSTCPKLSSVILPDSLESIGANAFLSCGIKEISAPISVDLRGERLCNPFFHCFSVEKITLTPGTGHAFNYHEAYKKTVWHTTKAPLTLSIADGVQSIGENMFYECKNLTQITLPDSVREIGNGAFQKCKNLNTIEFGSGLESVSSTAFTGFSFYDSTGNALSITVENLKGFVFKGKPGNMVRQQN